MIGTNPNGIQHTWEDTILTKSFWRRHFTKSGASTPKELAVWDGNGKIDYHVDQKKTAKAIIKVDNSYLGMGDKIVKDFDLSTEKGKKDIKEIFEKEYKNQKALLLDFVLPNNKLKTHTLDIVTIKCPDGNYQVLSCLFWGDCQEDTSHTATAAYTIDVGTEQIASQLAQYCVYFNKEVRTGPIGRKIPGIQEACRLAIEAHKNVNKEQEWLTAVGWDCMITEDSQVVFFEGNFACARCPRNMFLNASNLKDFITDFFWPFDANKSV